MKGYKAMNLCFFSGKIISEIEFEFIINSNNISIAYFDLQLSNESIIKVIGYDEMADYCYRNLRKGEFVSVEGFLNNNYEVVLNEINTIKFMVNKSQY